MEGREPDQRPLPAAHSVHRHGRASAVWPAPGVAGC